MERPDFPWELLAFKVGDDVEILQGGSLITGKTGQVTAAAIQIEYSKFPPDFGRTIEVDVGGVGRVWVRPRFLRKVRQRET